MSSDYLIGSDEIRVRTVGAFLRAYWTETIHSYSTAFGAGGACVHLRWHVVRSCGRILKVPIAETSAALDLLVLGAIQSGDAT